MNDLGIGVDVNGGAIGDPDLIARVPDHSAIEGEIDTIEDDVPVGCTINIFIDDTIISQGNISDHLGVGSRCEVADILFRRYEILCFSQVDPLKWKIEGEGE